MKYSRQLKAQTLILAALAILPAAPLFAQVTQDAQSYCAYEAEQAEAQKTLFRAPNLQAGISQPTQAVPAMTYAGFASSLSNFRKSQLVGSAAKDTCELYRATIDAQEHIAYALPSIEKEALAKRQSLDSTAAAELRTMIDEQRKKVDARDATLDSLYILQSAEAKLEADRSTTELTLTSISVPALSETPLKDLAAVKQRLELETQQATAKVNKQDNWDVTLMVGVRHNASPFFMTAPGAYGGFDAKWNLGSWKRDHELDQTASDYAEWKRQEDNDVMQNLTLLREQIQHSIEAQERALAAMRANEELIESNRDKIKGIETDAAILFRNQLTVDELSLRVEIGTAEFRLARLKQYLAANF